MDEEKAGEYPIREEAAFKILGYDNSDAKGVIEVSREVWVALFVSAYDGNVPVSKRALLDALNLARALDAGYIKAEEVVGMHTERMHAAMIGAAQRIVSEGDRKRGERLAFRDFEDEMAERMFGDGKSEPRSMVFMNGADRDVALSYPSNLGHLAVKPRIISAIAARLKTMGSNVAIGDVIGVESDLVGRIINFRVELVTTKDDPYEAEVVVDHAANRAAKRRVAAIMKKRKARKTSKRRK